MARNYKSEYKNYQGTSEQIANRSNRNSARAALAKDGRVSKGDGMDVDHKKPIAKGGSNAPSNLRAVPKSANRSFARTRTARMK
jgi:hypothetical protein